jgi:oligoendopeptidase F
MRCVGQHIVVSLWLISSIVYSQERFEAIPESIKTEYRIDFSRLFFSNRFQERLDYNRLQTMLTEIESFNGRLLHSPADILLALQLNDSIQVKLALHDAYLYLRYAVNTKDAASKNDDDALIAEVNSRTQALDQELRQIPDDTLSYYFHVVPQLEPYLFEITSSRRFRPYTLSTGEEKTLGVMVPFISGWQSDLYENLIAQTHFKDIQTINGTLNVWKDRNAISDSHDRGIRETGFKERFAGFAGQRTLYAFALLNTVQARNSLSRVHHYRDFPDEVFFSRYLKTNAAKKLLKEITQHADIYKRYQNIRADHVKAMNRYSDVNYWDMTAGATQSILPRFTIEEATFTITKALSPLGKEYISEFVQLLNPANGRIDIVHGDNRLSAGGGVGFPGIPNVFYSNGYTGSYKDVSVLAHEGGHVVHFQMMGNNHVKPAYGSGPSYFSESFSIFNELVLADYLYNHETDPARKIFYIEQFFEVKGMEIFRAAHDAALEQAIYDGVEQDSIHSADDLDTLTYFIDSQFSIWTSKHPELKEQWMTSRLMYEDPLYLINYVYGGLLSLKYFEMFKENPTDFHDRYIALMRNGFDDTPEHLLKKFLNIDLDNSNTLLSALKLLESKLDDLKQLYLQFEMKGR